MSYRIEARQTSEGGPDGELYQVVDDEGREYCRNSGGGIEDCNSITGAVERYNELSGDTRDPADGFDVLMIDGVEQTRIGDYPEEPEEEEEEIVWDEEDMIAAAIEDCWVDYPWFEAADCEVRESTDSDGEPCLIVLHRPSGRTSDEAGNSGRWHLDGTACHQGA